MLQRDSWAAFSVPKSVCLSLSYTHCILKSTLDFSASPRAGPQQHDTEKFLHLNNHIRQVRQQCLQSVNSLQTHCICFTQVLRREMFLFYRTGLSCLLALPFFLTLASVSLNLHIIQPVTLRVCQGAVHPCWLPRKLAEIFKLTKSLVSTYISVTATVHDGKILTISAHLCSNATVHFNDSFSKANC